MSEPPELLPALQALGFDVQEREALLYTVSRGDVVYLRDVTHAELGQWILDRLVPPVSRRHKLRRALRALAVDFGYAPALRTDGDFLVEAFRVFAFDVRQAVERRMPASKRPSISPLEILVDDFADLVDALPEHVNDGDIAGGVP